MVRRENPLPPSSAGAMPSSAPTSLASPRLNPVERDAVKVGMGRIESRFARAVLELAQHETSGEALERLRHGLPPRWRRILSQDVCGTLARDATLDLDSGIELLTCIERVLSGGSGVLTSNVLESLASRVLSRSPGLIVPGDMLGTLQHLRAPFEQPFIDAEIRFGARRAVAGFLLEVELIGRPSAAAWLGWAGLGYARAAARFSGANLSEFRFDCRLAGSVARVMGSRTATGMMRLPGEATLSPLPEVRPRTLPPRRRSSPTNAAARVEEILRHAPSQAASRPSAEFEVPHLASSTSQPQSEAPRRLESGLRPAIRAARLASRRVAR
jgi:hypothetical protein